MIGNDYNDMNVYHLEGSFMLHTYSLLKKDFIYVFEREKEHEQAGEKTTDSLLSRELMWA